MYATEATAPQADRPTPQLDRITDMASYAERTAERLQKAIERYHGVSQLAGKGENAVPPIPSGHNAQINRLEDALGLLSKLTNNIEEII
jgi:hypothetical protein